MTHFSSELFLNIDEYVDPRLDPILDPRREKIALCREPSKVPLDPVCVELPPAPIAEDLVGSGGRLRQPAAVPPTLGYANLLLLVNP